MTEEQVIEITKAAKRATASFRGEGLQKRSAFFNCLAKLLGEKRNDIKVANAKDIEQAKENQLSKSMIDRLVLNDQRIDDLIASLGEIDKFEDPLNISEGRMLENGLVLQKVKVGIGVVGFIYESRPNVTIDAVALCVKSGNAVILKGGKEAIHSNIILETLCRKALLEVGLPVELATLLDCSDRKMVEYLVKQEETVDVVIPRGGHGLIRAVVEMSQVPVIKHDAGNCHIYVHESADFDKAYAIINNAKTQRTGVCNALESLVIDQAVYQQFLPELERVLEGVELRACEKSHGVFKNSVEASEEDYGEEYLDMILSVKVVNGINEAIEHITKYSSGHTEAILAQNIDATTRFLNEIDSSVVLVNASTRFSDGGQFGLGAEIGISTNRLHARGPMGAHQLTTYKYQVLGSGQIRG